MLGLSSTTDACSVKVGVDVHIVFGGERTVYGEQVSGRQVVKIDTTQEIAVEMTHLNFSRVSHDCQLLDNHVVLVTGGLPKKGADPSEILPDELYNVTSQEVVKVQSKHL